MELRGKEGKHSYAPASTEGEDGNRVNASKLFEKVLDRENLNLAYKRVKKNGGSHGVDGMKVEELLPYFKQHGGGISLLGIPTAVDRMIQQSLAQVLSPIFEKEFSEYSYGFRPGRNAHYAIKQSEEYINEGYNVVVDLDLEKFFDRVNHDKLMYLLSKRIIDKLY